MTDLLDQLNQYTGPGVISANAIIIVFVTWSVRKIGELVKHQAELLSQHTKLMHLIVGIEGKGGVLNELERLEKIIDLTQARTDETLKEMKARLDRHHHAIATIQTRMHINDPKINGD